MVGHKRRKRSGLSGLKANAAYDAFQRLRDVFVRFENNETEELVNATEEEKQEADAATKAAEDAEREVLLIMARLENLLSKAAGSKVTFKDIHSPRHSTVSNVTSFEMLRDVIGVRPANKEFLSLKKAPSVIQELVSRSTTLGEGQFWSATNTRSHVNFILRTVPIESGAAARLLVDALFYRAASMFPADSTKAMVLHLEARAPDTKVDEESSTSIHGFIDYVCLVVERDKILDTMESLAIATLRGGVGAFFTAEAKKKLELPVHLPQALAEQYACAIQLKVPILRGALTNGVEWVFTVVYVDRNGGGTYRRSNVMQLPLETSLWDPPTLSQDPKLDIIALVLHDSICNSYSDILQEECFVQDT
ncbi:hypothetical protein C8R47DRAFT_533024 [Mycena vitilis]|nr:hypothetical protein C8R47DRAFT_533024 [Mycena vitilis]